MNELTRFEWDCLNVIAQFDRADPITIRTGVRNFSDYSFDRNRFCFAILKLDNAGLVFNHQYSSQSDQLSVTKQGERLLAAHCGTSKTVATDSDE